MKKVKYFILLFIIGASLSLRAQGGLIVDNEVGVFLGPTFMQTDYGEAKQFKSTINNTGFGFAIAYIADFSNSRLNSGIGRGFTEHVKLRAELSYAKANFAYDGKPVEEANSEQARFMAMEGSTKLLGFGVFTEIYFFNLIDDKKLQPYLLLGGSFTSAKPTLKSSLQLPSIYLPEEENVFLDTQKVFSFTGGVGSRYKLDDVDILFEYKYNMFFSDRIEGLDSDFSGDKHNDGQTIFNIGVVFHIDY